jgi:hypothetical protein
MVSRMAARTGFVYRFRTRLIITLPLALMLATVSSAGPEVNSSILSIDIFMVVSCNEKSKPNR